MSDKPKITLAKESLEKLREAVRATPNGEHHLALMEQHVNDMIAPFVKQGANGAMFLALLSAICLIRIDEIPLPQ